MLPYCQFRIMSLSAEKGEKQAVRLKSPANKRAKTPDVTNLLALQELGIDKTEVQFL